MLAAQGRASGQKVAHSRSRVGRARDEAASFLKTKSGQTQSDVRRYRYPNTEGTPETGLSRDEKVPRSRFHVKSVSRRLTAATPSRPRCNSRSRTPEAATTRGRSLPLLRGSTSRSPPQSSPSACAAVRTRPSSPRASERSRRNRRSARPPTPFRNLSGVLF